MNTIALSKFPAAVTYDGGSMVTLQAVPADGWAFSGWAGAAKGTDNPVTVTVSCSGRITALFEPSEGAEKAYIPHITGDSKDWTDTLEADNLGQTSSAFTLALYGPDGMPLYRGVHTVEGMSRLLLSLKDLNAFTAGAAAGKISYDDPGLTFRQTQRHLTGGGTAQFTLSSRLSSDLGMFFSNVDERLSQKGMALSNFNTAAQDVTLEAIANGQLVGNTTITLMPNQKFSGTMSQLFGNSGNCRIQAVRARSSGTGLSGLVMSSDAAFSFILFTSAQPLD